MIRLKKCWGKFDMGNALNSKEDSAIDFAKFVCSILIISIHTQPFKDYSYVINCYLEDVFSRLAICLFFVISGFYFFKGIDFENGKIKKSKENRNKLLKYVSRVFILYAVWSFIYLLWMIPEWYQTGWLSIKAFIDFGISFFLNSSYYHLWFLVSLVYAIPIIYFILRFVSLKAFALICSTIYILGVLTNTYSFIGLPFNEVFQKIWDKFPALWTVIFFAIPILTASIIVNKINVKRRICISLAVLFFVGYSIEATSLNLTTAIPHFSYITFLTIPAAMFLFITVKSINIKFKNSYLLRKTSTVIYCIHPLIMNIVQACVNKNEINSLLYFTVTVVFSIFVSILIFTAYKKLKFCKFLKYIM